MKKFVFMFLLLVTVWFWSFRVVWNSDKKFITEPESGSQKSDILERLSGSYDPGVESGLCSPSNREFSKGLVSLTFDDGWKEIYLNAIPILDKAGMKSTQYVSTRVLKTNDAYGNYMSVADVLDMDHKGHEIGSHAVEHLRLNKMEKHAAADQIIRSKKELLDMGVSSVDTFAPPYGEYTDFTTETGRKFYSAIRVTDAGLNDRRTDPHLLSSHMAENWMIFDPYLKRLVDRSVKEKKWLILIFHQVADANYRYYTSPEDLVALINYLIEKEVPVMTVRDVVQGCYSDKK